MSNLQPDFAPIVKTIAEETRFVDLKEKAQRFRVLIIGGANAGKTTILKKICDTTNDPEIYDKEGQKLGTSTLEPTVSRGYHDIGNEMIFRDNPTFIFHDSRGFEAGGVDEFRMVKSFVAEQGKKKELKNQVHVIWYCIAMDDDRPITYAENQFFSESGTGKVPVIAVFTKCEALELKAIATLEDEGHTFDKAAEMAPGYVEERLKNVHKMLEKMKYPPKGHIYLQELDKPGVDCSRLVECTLNALDYGTLQRLLISTQVNALELSIKYSLR
ncbi:GTP-binding protein [Collybia nuda]|uniref:GTP-binding protein n=1 Tax=Collybia nuda TaxID=64659 RepID=A0A9P5Y297_9AGAR|nr:GTP-binding protein [Collybia nuda]